MSKPKSTAKLLMLPEEQQAQLAEWLLGGMPYHEAQKKVLADFGLQVGSLATFSAFWELVCEPHLLARRKRMAGTAKERAEAAAEDPGEFDTATLDALRERAYSLAENANANPKDVKAIMTLLLKAQDQAFKERQLAFDVTKFRFDAVATVKSRWAELSAIMQNSGLDSDAKTEALGKHIFGEDWE